jgi:hypothetical protein
MLGRQCAFLLLFFAVNEGGEFAGSQHMTERPIKFYGSIRTIETVISYEKKWGIRLFESGQR